MIKENGAAIVRGDCQRMEESPQRKKLENEHAGSKGFVAKVIHFFKNLISY